MSVDQSEVLTQSFQEGPYNFDVPPPGSVIGPIKTLLTAAGTFINNFINDVNNLTLQVSVTNATGLYLRAHAVFYGITPFPNETDDALRARILAAPFEDKLTIPAIQDLVTNYFASVYPFDEIIITVCDLQSNPTLAAEAGLTFNDFLILGDYEIPIDDAWFLDYSYLDYTTYLLASEGTFFPWTPDEALIAQVNKNKAGGENPVYYQEYSFI